MKLGHLTDYVLLAETKTLAQRERTITSQVLWHIKEVDDRKLYSDLRYPSLFEYCQQELGYSASSAQRRIVAARALEQMPEIAPKIESGELTLSSVSLITSAFEPGERPQMMELASHKSTEQVKQIIREEKDLPKTFTVTMDEETFKLWQQMRNLGIDLKQVVAQAKKTKEASPLKRAVLNRDKVCQQCGSAHRLEVDHRQPKALSGSNDLSNLRVLCRNCNQRKRISAGLKPSVHFRRGSKLATTKRTPKRRSAWPKRNPSR